MTSFNNLNSSAISKVEVNDSDVMITYTTSGNEYKYALNGINSVDFVNTMNDIVQNGRSVGKFVNKSIKEDKTLQIVAIWL